MAVKFGPREYGARTTYSASGNINEDLSVPYTITRLAVFVDVDITTTSQTLFNDYWDRIITSLSLATPTRTFFNFTSMRAGMHSQRFRLGPLAPRRPDPAGNDLTAQPFRFVYLFHFGVAPMKVNAAGMPVDNPFDLTGGIPPSSANQLTLSGVFGAAAAPGTNATVNAATRVRYYSWGVQATSGDRYEDYMPQAYPEWSMRTPTPTATSSEFGTSDNVPVGTFLHSLMIMTTNGTNAPRGDDVLGSFKLRLPNDGGREILSYRSFDAAVRLSQLGTFNGIDFEEVPVLTEDRDVGLLWVPLVPYVRPPQGHEHYGADLKGLSTGDLSMEYGVNDATGVTMDVVYHRYTLDSQHPANAGR